MAVIKSVNNSKTKIQYVSLGCANDEYKGIAIFAFDCIRRRFYVLADKFINVALAIIKCDIYFACCFHRTDKDLDVDTKRSDILTNYKLKI